MIRNLGRSDNSPTTVAVLTVFCLQVATADVLVNKYFPSKNETLNINNYDDLAALGSWSKPLTEDGTEGWLIYASPPQACRNLSPAPHGTVYKPWILMAQRGNCSFGEKAKNAESAGYGALIIHNVNSDSPMRMSGGDYSVGIPVISMGELQAYDLLRYNYKVSPLYTIKITDGVDFAWLDKYLWPFFGIITGCFCCMAIYIVVKWAVERRRVRRIASRRRLTDKQLKKIPTKKFKKGDAYEVCAICLDDYEENDKLRILPCNHAYHTKCVDPWLTKSRKSCPVCKRKILSKKEAARKREREESEARRRDAEAENEREEATEGETSAEEEDEDEGRGSGAEEEERLILEPRLTVVDRLRRFFRQRNSEIQEPITEGHSNPRTGRGSRTSYGSMDQNDANRQIEAAEQHLRENVDRRHDRRQNRGSGDLNPTDGASGSSPAERRSLEPRRQRRSPEVVLVTPPVTTVEATVHVTPRIESSEIDEEDVALVVPSGDHVV